MYARLKGNTERFQLEYLSTAPPFRAQEELRQGLQQALAAGRRREVALGSTQVGPHRDDLRITASGREVGVYGSRGERRLAALVLRLSEGEFLAQRRGEQPVLLLDDILSELDQTRGRQVLAAVARYQQVLLTTTEEPPLAWRAVSPAATFRVARGTVTPVPGAI
jgi:DNA replication and repair protein RecF